MEENDNIQKYSEWPTSPAPFSKSLIFGEIGPYIMFFGMGVLVIPI